MAVYIYDYTLTQKVTGEKFKKKTHVELLTTHSLIFMCMWHMGVI